MNSESKTNTVFRPLKKASTVAFLALALFASVSHADLAPTATGAAADAMFDSIKGAPMVTKETKSSISLIKSDKERHIDCTQTINLKTRQKETLCTEFDAASVAK
jgi:hypothetical protein